MSRQPSPIESVRIEAARILRERGAPMHVNALAREALAALRIQMPTKLVTNGLHKDPQGRFERVGPGTWKLRANPPEQPR